MPETNEAAAGPASKAFASRLAKFAYSGPSTPPRRVGSSASSPRGLEGDLDSRIQSPTRGTRSRAVKPKVVLKTESNDAEEEEVTVSEPSGGSTATPQRKSGRGPGAKEPKRSGSADDAPSRKKAKKVPRPYAGPEVYAHLNNTPDHLGPELDIIFCGINPGKKSAATGTHFAHPTNKFWRALHQSGLTPRLYAPSECHLLPIDLNCGLTNLCGRPTAEQSELSTLEMRLNVHPFTLKLIQLRPRVVCFVGKKIWDIYEALAGKTARPAVIRSLEPLVKEEDEATAPASPMASVDVSLDIKPEIPATPLRRSSKFTTPVSTSHAKAIPPAAFDWYAPRSLRLPLPPTADHAEWSYCYFWVTPSTSGLERTPIAEQVNIFAALHRFSQSLAHDDPPADGFRDIDIENLAVTSDKIRTEAIAKGTTVYPSVHALAPT